MDPKLWGPQVWFFLHNLPENVSPPSKIGSCVRHLVLPCPVCQNFLDQYKVSNPPEVIQSRADAHEYINTLHNKVNKKLGKPEINIEDCKKIWATKISLPKKGLRIVRDTFDDTNG